MSIRIIIACAVSGNWFDRATKSLVVPKNNGPCMCLINTSSFRFSGNANSSPHGSSLSDFISDFSEVRSPIFFMNISDAITSPIPTAYTKFHTLESTSTISIIATSGFGILGIALSPL